MNHRLQAERNGEEISRYNEDASTASTRWKHFMFLIWIFWLLVFQKNTIAWYIWLMESYFLFVQYCFVWLNHSFIHTVVYIFERILKTWTTFVMMQNIFSEYIRKKRLKKQKISDFFGLLNTEASLFSELYFVSSFFQWNLFRRCLGSNAMGWPRSSKKSCFFFFSFLFLFINNNLVSVESY